MSAVRSLEPWRWLGVPVLQVLGLSILFAIPLRIFGFRLPEPLFAMPMVFAWAIIRPSVLAPFAALATGLALDLLWGAPLGLWAVCLLLAYGLVLAGRSMTAGQNRGALWVWYGVVTAVAMAAGFLVTGMKSGAMPSLISVGWQYLATVLLYPLAQRLIDMFEDADVRFR